MKDTKVTLYGLPTDITVTQCGDTLSFVELNRHIICNDEFQADCVLDFLASQDYTGWDNSDIQDMITLATANNDDFPAAFNSVNDSVHEIL